MKPLLSYIGAKVWLVPWLNSLYLSTKAKRMNEIFCGGLSVSLGIGPRYALLNDNNPDIINFHRQVRDGLVLRATISTNSKEEYKRDFRAAVDRFNTLIKEGKRRTPEAADLLLLIGRKGFGNNIRYNSRGLLNSAPNYQNPKSHVKVDLSHYRDTMRHWKFTCKDFRKIRIRDGDFVYADPPYDSPHNVYLGGFTYKDQEDVAKKIAEYDGPSVISNYADEKIVEMYKDYGFTVEFVGSKREFMRNYAKVRAAGLESVYKSSKKTVLVTRNIKKKPQLISKSKHQ